MKDKRKIIVYDRIIRRFKKIFGAFIILFGLQYLLSYTVKSVKELEIEENEEKFGSFFTVDALDIGRLDILNSPTFCDKTK